MLNLSMCADRGRKGKKCILLCVTCHMSYVTNHMSSVMFNVPHVMCCILHVICHLSPVTNAKTVGSGEISRNKKINGAEPDLVAFCI